MRITIIGLDAEYKDCALEMGAKIYEHDSVIDCNFPPEVSIMTDSDLENVSITSPTVGMVLDFNEFFTITID